MSVRLAPSILSADFGRLAEAVAACEAGGADAIHFDVMDGRFVPNLTVGPVVLKALRRETRLPFDVHLMIEEPFRTLDQYLDAGAARVSVHVEAEPHLARFADRVRERGASPGVAINPGTSLHALDELLGILDFVLVMTVNPGWGGQSFRAGSLERIRKLRQSLLLGGGPFGAPQTPLRAEIAVDGGIGPENAAEVVRAGARHLVAGSSVFSRGGVGEALATLRAAAEGGLA